MNSSKNKSKRTISYVYLLLNFTFLEKKYSVELDFSRNDFVYETLFTNAYEHISGIPSGGGDRSGGAPASDQIGNANSITVI
jgi:hypothetical protein